PLGRPPAARRGERTARLADGGRGWDPSIRTGGERVARHLLAGNRHCRLRTGGRRAGEGRDRRRRHHPHQPPGDRAEPVARALAKEGYRRTRINAAELASLLRWPGFYRMGARYWRMGVSELSLALNKGAFARELQRYLPAVQAKDLSPAGAGVRAQAVSRDGRLLDDFVFSEEEGILHVRNAPSPAATACLAIAEVIADRVDR